MRTLTIAAALVALAACSSEPRETQDERPTAAPTAPLDPASARARQLEAEIDRLLAEQKALIERLKTAPDQAMAIRDDLTANQAEVDARRAELQALQPRPAR